MIFAEADKQASAMQVRQYVCDTRALLSRILRTVSTPVPDFDRCLALTTELALEIDEMQRVALRGLWCQGFGYALAAASKASLTCEGRRPTAAEHNGNSGKLGIVGVGTND